MTKGLEKRAVHAPLPKLGTEFGVHGIFEESYEKVEAEAENLSAASDGSGAASTLAAALKNLTLSGTSRSRHFDQVAPVE